MHERIDGWIDESLDGRGGKMGWTEFNCISYIYVSSFFHSLGSLLFLPQLLGLATADEDVRWKIHCGPLVCSQRD